MRKLFLLLKVSMTEDMNLFKISTKKNNAFTKIAVPIILSFVLMSVMYFYAELFISKLSPLNMEFVILTIFIILTSVMTLIEGIYKSGNLLFNCKDDNLLLSLPIKKRTVLFIRVFKFYAFELLYNSLFLIPAMFVYARYVNPSISFYALSVISLLVFPIIPILISCLIGTFTTFLASKFKGKNMVQTIISVLFLLGIMYLSYNSENLVANIAQNASGINDFITKLYYPAGAYIELVTNFNAPKLIEFILIHTVIFIIIIFLIGRVYFNINSKVKSVKNNKEKTEYKIKTSKPIIALIKKEFSRFINSTVFITNAGFGLVLFIIGCVLINIRLASILSMANQYELPISIEDINKYLPIILYGFVCFTSFMTSITSSMISLEGKSFNILKSLPIKPITIVKAKVLAAVIIMIPCILIGDFIAIFKYNFDILSIITIMIASILLPLLSETIGIYVNLKYPRMDAKNDTEVVKQSMSSSVSVFLGIGLFGLTVFLLYKAIAVGLSNNLILLFFTGGYAALYIVLSILLHYNAEKYFNNIVV